MKKLIFALAILVLVSVAPMWAQSGACSTQTIRGYYALTCTGFVSPAANAPQQPFSAIGTTTTTWAGSITGVAKASLGGVILDQAVTGTAVVNSDCTGTVSYDQKLNGQPAPKLNIVFHVLDDGKEIRGMAVDAGSTLSCNLRLISR
jgi:hypothetical protein